jgi:hypothetical protein
MTQPPRAKWGSGGWPESTRVDFEALERDHSQADAALRVARETKDEIWSRFQASGWRDLDLLAEHDLADTAYLAALDVARKASSALSEAENEAEREAERIQAESMIVEEGSS